MEKNIQVHKTYICNITFPEQVCVALLIQVFHCNIGHKCCGWLNYAHFKQTLNLMSFSSCSGHRLIRGKGIWQEEGNKRKVPPPSPPWPNSREHSSLQPPHRYSRLQKYWLYKPFAPQPARSICGRAAHVQCGKEQHKEHNNAFIYEARTRVPGMGLCPVSEAISVLAVELRSIRAPSADTDSKLSQS